MDVTRRHLRGDSIFRGGSRAPRNTNQDWSERHGVDELEGALVHLLPLVVRGAAQPIRGGEVAVRARHRTLAAPAPMLKRRELSAK
jgi:hypothetical protein